MLTYTKPHARPWSLLAAQPFLAALVLCAAPREVARAQVGASTPSPRAPERGLEPLFAPTIDDADPESSVPTSEEAMKNPLNMGYFIMALADRADAAAARGDHGKEARYYRAIVKAAPDRAIGYRRACRAHDAAGEWEKALAMCRGALGAGGVTVDDHLQFIRVLLKKPGALDDAEIADADAIVAGFEGELGLGKTDVGREVIAETRCQIGAKLESSTRLGTCTKALHDLKVEPAKIYSYEWALALSEGDEAAARDVIEEAKRAGLPAAATDAMARGLSKAAAAPSKHVALALWRNWWPVLLGAAALGALLLIKARRSRSEAA